MDEDQRNELELTDQPWLIQEGHAGIFAAKKENQQRMLQNVRLALVEVMRAPATQVQACTVDAYG